jgi:capsular polysaccharide export protein
MIKGGLSAFQGKRVLLLQGPLGPFFRRLAQDLTLAGAQVYKVNFNGGDWLFYPKGEFNYRGTMADWPAYFETLLDQLHVDVVMLFGDCRPIHVLIHEAVRRRGLKLGVFEEGYIRPDFVTLELQGVNGHSSIPRTPDFYLSHPATAIEPPIRAGNTFWFAARFAVLYYFAAGLLKPFFWHYQHHRPLNWLEGLPWLRSLWRKQYHAIQERDLLPALTEESASPFFLVPLQVHNDSQVQVHSDFDSVAVFIDDVISSFAKHAPKNTSLVIKHHPMDRGYYNYTKLINQLARIHGIKKRVRYIQDQHLPTLLQHACGVVVINSTVGLSALHHGTPLKVCGTALYDIEGLTFQGKLDDFWKHAQDYSIDPKLYESFKSYLIRHSQLNGSFYKRLDVTGSATGLVWGGEEQKRGTVLSANAADRHT